MDTEMKMLFESWRSYNTHTTPFMSLLKEHDNKRISDEQLFLEWKKQTLLEFKKLEEIDWEKEAELTADPDYKPPHERGGMLGKGWEKINDWLLQKSVELVDLAKRSLEAVVKAASWLMKKVKRFKEEHPILFILIMVVIATVVFSALATTASAKIATASGAILSDTAWEITRGFLHEYSQSQAPGLTDLDLKFDIGKAIRLLDSMHESDAVHNAADFKSSFGEIARLGTEQVVDLTEKFTNMPAGPEKERAGRLLLRWQDIGKSLEVTGV